VGERNSPLDLEGENLSVFPPHKKQGRPPKTGNAERQKDHASFAGVILGGRTATTTTDRRADAEKLADEKTKWV